MITDSSGDRRDRRLAWALVASILVHALVVPITLWISALHLRLIAPRQREQLIVSSTAIRLEHRAVARPRIIASLPHAPSVTRAAAAQAQPRPRAVPTRVPTPVPSATPQPRSATVPSFAQTLADQQRSFAQEAQRLHEQENPLSVATIAPRPPASLRKHYLDISGLHNRAITQVIVSGRRHWVSGSSSCWYVEYRAELGSGARENGVIPWPICYPIGDDRIARSPTGSEVPLPPAPPNYILPAGTYLTPLLRQLYSVGSGYP